MSETIDHDFVKRLLELYHAGMNVESTDKREAVKLFKEILDHKLEGCKSGISEIDQTIFNIAKSTKHNLGCKLYELGDISEGIKFFHEAAELGHSGSMYYLGVYYESLNHVSAVTFFVRAAKLGHEKALEAVNDLKIQHLLDL